MEDKEFNLEEELKEVKEKREQQEIEFDKRTQEALKRYKVIRIAQKAGAMIAAIGIITAHFIIREGRKHDWGLPEPQPTVTEVDDSIYMSTYYTIKSGDTLSGISNRTGISVQDIASYNGIDDPHSIYPNQRIELLYKIDPEDLEYYTETINVEGRDIEEISNMYNTTPTTIFRLNENSIEINHDGTYTILSNTIVVPNFITQSELEELKGKSK